MTGRASAEVTRALWDHLNNGATIAGAARLHGVHIRSLRRALRRFEALPSDKQALMLSPLARTAILAGAVIGPARVVATEPLKAL